MRTAWLLLPLLLAGCAEPAPAPDVVVLQRESHAEQDGLALAFTVHDHPDGVRLRAAVVNEGNRTHQVSAVCTSPWTWSLDGPDRGDGDGPVCLAYGRRPLAPGAMDADDRLWDATVMEDGRRRPLAPGAYTWTVRYCTEDAEARPHVCVAAQIPFRLA